MRRREFIAGLGGTVVSPLTARAQQTERMRRVGILAAYSEKDTETVNRTSAFREALKELGWIDGRNVQFVYRTAAADPFLMREHAAELVRQTPDVILANTTPITAALKTVTSTIPIVFAGGGDPVVAGIVTSLSRPDGNITGFPITEPSLAGKWLDVLMEAAPKTRLVLVLHAPENPIRAQYISAINAANAKRAIELIHVDVHAGEHIAQILREPSVTKEAALLVLPGASTSVHRTSIIGAAALYRLPAIFPFQFFAAEGGLLAYGANYLELFRRAATYVDRILRGAKPSDLPVQVPTKFDLIINLKTAHALGLTIPPTLLARADEVIE